MSEETTPAIFEINETSLSYLGTIRKWSKFFAVLGFVMLGLMVLAGFSAGFIMNAVQQQSPFPTSFPTTLFGLVYLVFAAIYFFPLLFLLRFANTAKQALQERSSAKIEHAFRHLRDHFSYMGILTIVMMSIYVVAMLIAVIVIVLGVNYANQAGIA